MNLALSVQYATARRGLPRRPAIRRWVLAALAGVRRSRVAVGVRIVGGRESAALNRHYRGKRGPTDVLSFPFAAPRGVKSDVLGDLVLCAPLARRAARAERIVEEAHWAHLVVHGIMHLRGYTHENEKDATAMERREARALETLGYPDPYAAARSRTHG